MWEVRAGSAKAYLFGDSGPLRAPWRSARFDAALADSQAFWKETPDTSARGLFLAKGIDPARPLSTWLMPKDQARVAAAVGTVGLTSASLERFRPWLAAVVLDSSFRSHFGFKQENGPEHALVAAAKAGAKPIHSEFADVAEIVDYFAGFSKAAEVGALMRAVEDVEAGPDAAQRDADAWAAGDQGPATAKVRGLNRAYPDYYQAILVARNHRWPPRFRSYAGWRRDDFRPRRRRSSRRPRQRPEPACGRWHAGPPGLATQPSQVAAALLQMRRSAWKRRT